jgi:hypothetical protein
MKPTPQELVASYVREATPLHTTSGKGPEQLASGRAILELDEDDRARAVVAAYASLPKTHANAYGRNIMLGVLATTLLRAKLPLDEDQLLTMIEGAASSVGPSLGPCDYDVALTKALARHYRGLNPRMKVALRKVIARRGVNRAPDRRVGAACKKLLER